MNADLSASQWEIGVEAAYAANEALKQQEQADSHLEQLNDAAMIEGVIIEPGAREDLDRKGTEASISHESFSEVVGLMIGRDVWVNDALEVSVQVPEIDDETAKRLEALSPEFAGLVTTRYADAYRVVDGYIREGRLHESYRMPALSELIDEIEAVAPAFEAMYAFESMAEEAWKPSVEFVPVGLTSEEWGGLFASHKLPNGEQMVGNYRAIPHATIDTVGRRRENEKAWDVAVISAAERPIYTQVSKDGKKGDKAQEAVETFIRLPWVTATAKKPADVIAQVSPREEVYNRLQLARLERGEQPVDNETWTISQENVKVDGQVGSVVQFFYPYYRRVRSVWDDLDYAYGYGGVRPSASGSDLVFRASA